MSNELPDRFDVERAIEASKLPTCSRDILFLLARKMDQGGILIPGRFSPSLYRMASASGWSKRHIQRHLNRLERDRVIVRSRDKGRRTRYAVVWPTLAELGTQSPDDGEKTGDTASPPLGTTGPRGRDTVAPQLGTRSRGTRDTVARSQISQHVPDPEPDPEVAMIRGLLEAKTGRAVTEEWAAATRDTIVAAAGAPKTPGAARSAYIRKVIVRDPQPQKWLPTPQPPQYQRGDAE